MASDGILVPWMKDVNLSSRPPREPASNDCLRIAGGSFKLPIFVQTHGPNACMQETGTCSAIRLQAMMSSESRRQRYFPVDFMMALLRAKPGPLLERSQTSLQRRGWEAHLSGAITQQKLHPETEIEELELPVLQNSSR